MAIKISALPEETVVTDNDVVAIVDVETTTTKKSKVSTFFNWLLGRANTWTGTNQFNKQVKIKSDGTNSPLVVRDNTDTVTKFEVKDGGATKINADYTYYEVHSNNPGGLAWYNATGLLKSFINANIGGGTIGINPTTNTTESTTIGANYVNVAGNLQLVSKNTNGGDLDLNSAFISSNTSVGIAIGNATIDKRTILFARTSFGYRSVIEWTNDTTKDDTIVQLGKSGNGRMIIGGTTPNASAKLQVQGQTRIVSDGTNSPLVVRDSTDTNNVLEVNADGSRVYVHGMTKFIEFKSGQANTSGGGIIWSNNTTNSWSMSAGANVVEFVRNYQFSNNKVHIRENELLLGAHKVTDYLLLSGDKPAYGALLAGGQISGGANQSNLSITPNYYHTGVDGGTLTLSCADGVNQTSMLEYTTSTNVLLKLVKSKGRVVIGANTSDASAKLQVDSTTQGFLPPRMTTTQRNAIATPAEGLMVYDTTVKGWFGYDGTNWIQL